MDSSYLPVWLQSLGYATYFAGKFLNQLTTSYVTRPACPRGWNQFYPLIDGGASKTYSQWYYYPVFSNNCNGLETYNHTYQTDIIRDKGLGYIE